MINIENQSEERDIDQQNEDKVSIIYREITYKDLLDKKDKPCCSFCCCWKTIDNICEMCDSNIIQDLMEINNNLKYMQYINGKIKYITALSIITLIFNIGALFLSFILKPKYEHIKNICFRRLDGDLIDMFENVNILPNLKLLSNISNYQIGVSIFNIIFNILLLIFEFLHLCKYNETIINKEKKQGKEQKK